MTRTTGIIMVWLILAASTAATAADSAFLRIDHAGPIGWERIKVFNDQVYFYQMSLRKLTRFDSQGKVLSEYRLDTQELHELLPAKDFAVGSEGQVLLVGRTRSGGTYLLALSESGEAQQIELDKPLDARKIALLPDGALVILGWDEVAFEALKALSQPNRASSRGVPVPQDPIPILHRCDPVSHTSREMAYLPLAPKPHFASKIAWSLYLTPLIADWQGNVYFSTTGGLIHIRPSRGGLKSERLPSSREEVQVVHNILAHPDGSVLVAVQEGSNVASEEDKAEGLIGMLSPNMRVFSYGPKGFEEIYSGHEVQSLLGVFSDGAWVTAFKNRTSIDLARFDPPPAPSSRLSR